MEAEDVLAEKLEAQQNNSTKRPRKRRAPRSAANPWTNRALDLVMPALFDIPRRAERRSGEAIRRTFVNLGTLAASLASREHQVVYGRRGTGKTHALENLGESLRSRGEDVVAVDLRTVGSAGSYYLDGGRGIAASATRVIVDLLEDIHEQLYARSVQLMEAEHEVTALVRHLDALCTAACSVNVVGNTETVEETSTGHRSDHALTINALPQPALGIGVSEGVSRARVHRRSQSGVENFSLQFGPIARSFQGIVKNLPRRGMWLLLDEWSAVPTAIQPLVADFLRRCLLPIDGVVVKIAAIHNRSQFSHRSGGSYVGLELGADVMQDLDLDEYLAWNARDQRAEQFFSNLFARHISEYWRDEGQNVEPDHIGYQLSAALPGFEYLVMASGGVPRDAINVAAMAAQDSSQAPVELQHICAASRRWFLNDKERQIRDDPRSRRVVQGLRVYAETRKKRGFLLSRHHDAPSAEVQGLYDARLIHRVASGVGPSARYDAYILDFGMYADIVSDTESLRGWSDNWLWRWHDFDPSQAPEVRQAVTSLEQLKRLAR